MSKKVFIVDDSAFSIKCIGELFKNEQTKFELVATSTDPQNALEQIILTKPDIVLCDIVMPKISGLELGKLIKESLPSTHIIFMSALRNEQIVMEAISIGASDFLQKPFTEDILFSSFTKVTQGD